MAELAAAPLSRAALFLDFDGALAAFQGDPEAVQPTPELIVLLRDLRRGLDGRLAVLSGRTLADLDRVTGGEAPVAAALNGLQRRAPGRRLADPPPHEGLAEAEDILAGLARTWPGVRAERKGLSVALHYRHAGETCDELRRMVRAIGHATGLAIQEGEMVVELATPGWDKGLAIRELMAEAPFRGSVPIFVGDDAADEPGFVAVKELGGAGILVGEPRPTAAAGRLATSAALHAWLRRGLRDGAFVMPARPQAASPRTPAG